jgi:hypothetical protein
VRLKDVRVELKDGRVFYGPLYEIRSTEGWFSLTIDLLNYPDAPDSFHFGDCVSVVNRGVQTAYNKIEDVDLIEWAAKDALDRAALAAKYVKREPETVELSDEDTAAFEAAVAQADSEHAPAIGSVVWQREVDLVLATITHPAGYAVDLFDGWCSLLSIKGLSDGTFEVGEEGTESERDTVGCDWVRPVASETVFQDPRAAAEYFVTRRYALKLGHDFEQPKWARPK